MMKRKRRITKAYFELACRKYAPLVNRLSILVGINQIHTEELKYQADEELLKCMICYNSSGSFMTFLYCRLHNIFRHMRDSENRARRIRTGVMGSLTNMSDKNTEDVDFPLMVNECFDCLTDDERNLIVEVFFNHKTMREISLDSGISLSSLGRMKKGAIGKMRVKCGMELV